MEELWKTGADVDKALAEMMEADAIRATLVPGQSKNFYLVDQPWNMREEPWVIQWFDPRIERLCEVYPVGMPYPGDKYVMFTTFSEEEKVIRNYVFINEQYHYIEDENAPSDD